MKKQLTTKTATLATIVGLGALGTASSSAAIIIAGWDTFDSNTAPSSTAVATGVTATATTSAASGNWSNGDNSGRGSSDDTTWGTFDGNGTAASTVSDVGPANLTAFNGVVTAEVTLTITNNGTVDLDLANFHMDVVAFRPNAPRTYSLNVLAGSNITVGNVITSTEDEITHLAGVLSGHDQHDDLDLDLSGLADHTLAIGEQAIIQIAFSDGSGSGGGHHLFLDNVAISGDVAVPEPSSALLALVSGAFLLRRRR